MRAAERYHAIAAAGGWGTLPKGAPLKLGDKGQLVVKLKERLQATNDLARDSLAGEAFDPAVLASVKRFQGRHGLPETGLVGPRTIDGAQRSCGRTGAPALRLGAAACRHALSFR